MSNQEIISETVDDFLKREKSKVLEERILLQKLLNQLVEQQNRLPASCRNEGVAEENEVIKPALTSISQKNILKEQNSIKSEKSSLEDNDHQPADHVKFFCREIEKERLARIFENSPQYFNQKCKQQRYKRRQKNDQDKENPDSSFEKENINPEYCTLIHGTKSFDTSSIYEKWDGKDDFVRSMVRFGEFSPLNPAFSYSGKSFLGFGEYEERRKIFLEKKKQEYQQYLINARNNRTSKLARSTSLREYRSVGDRDSETSSRPGSSISQMSSHFRKDLTPERNQDFIKRQQESYRKELDKQVEEKRKMKQEQENKEKKECENCELLETLQRKNLSKSIENEFQRRMNYYNNDESQTRAPENRYQKSDIPTKETSISSRCGEGHDLIIGKDPRVTSRIKSPILKHTTEACAVESIEAYQKMKKELYKKELAKQIQEKKRLEEERKAKELELERKTDEKIQKEEEKQRRDYEKEQADIAYRAYQKAELEKKLADNFCKIKKENDEKKKTKTKPVPKPISKMSTIYATGHKFSDTHATKNVSFLPHAFVYDIRTEALHERNVDESNQKSDSIIIQAPYVLATKNILEHSCYGNTYRDSNREEHRPTSPILPAVKTKSILNSIPKPNDLVIPPGVSMSKEAKNRYLKDDKILSNLSEIRRNLLKNQSNNIDNS